MLIQKSTLSISILLVSFFAFAQESKTLTLDSGQVSPSAKIGQMSWVAGSWEGEAFGGKTEEVWTTPSAGSMMCAFKLSVEDQVRFYEFCTISEENESLLLKIKHFNRDMTGWEDKEKSVEFPLVKMTDNRAYFDGFTFEKNGKNSMTIYVVIEQKDGSQSEVPFPYKRKS